MLLAAKVRRARPRGPQQEPSIPQQRICGLFAIQAAWCAWAKRGPRRSCERDEQHRNRKPDGCCGNGCSYLCHSGPRIETTRRSTGVQWKIKWETRWSSHDSRCTCVVAVLAAGTANSCPRRAPAPAAAVPAPFVAVALPLCVWWWWGGLWRYGPFLI